MSIGSTSNATPISASIRRMRLVVTACAVVLLGFPTIAFAQTTYTWSGGATGGTWNTTSANWNAGAVVWPNIASPADSSTFANTGSVSIAAGTIYVNSIALSGSATAFTGAGSSNTTLAFTGAGAAVTCANLGGSFSNLTLDTGAGLLFRPDGGNFTLNAGVAITGTGAFTLGWGSANYGTGLNLGANANSSFTGGFVIAKPAGRIRRHAVITGTVANAFGTGAASASGQGSQFVYVQGGQTAVSGTTAGLTVTSGAMIQMSGAFNSSSRDRFTVGSEAYLYGTTTQLAQVRRVTSFSSSPTQAETILASGATIVTTTTNANIDTALSGMNLGTSADLLFGLGANFASSAFNITVGANTPWQGFSTDGNQESGSRVLSSGTVTVNTGGGSFNELRFQANGIDYSLGFVPFVLGSTASAPTFVKNGAGDVVARVMPVSQLSLDNATVGNIFARFAVDAGSLLQSVETNALNGKNVSLSASSLGIGNAGAAEVVTDTVGTLTFADVSSVLSTIRTATTGTSRLTINAIDRSGLAVLNITPNVSGTLGSTLQRVYVPSSLQRGNMAAPYVVSGTHFLTDTGTASVGLQPATYNTSAWGDGVVRGITASTAVSGSVSADSARLLADLTGSGTIQLGILPNGSRAAQAGLMTVAGNASFSVAPTLDLGGSELVAWVLHERTTNATTLSGPLLTSGGLSKNGVSALVLSNAANSITGPVAVNQGTLRISGGNGLGDAATLYVGPTGTFDLSGASDQVALLTGSGAVAVASTRTLTVSGAASGTFAGVISGAGGLVKGGAGGLTLSGNNTFAGGASVGGGTLRLANASALGAAGSTLAVNGGTLDLGGYSVSVGTLSGSSGAAITTAAAAGTATLTTSFASGTSSFAGSITNNGSGVVAIVKSGGGTLVLSGSNAHSGGTTLTAGGLDINHSAALGSGAFTIGGGTLGNSSGAAVTVSGNNAQSWTGDFAFAGTSSLNLGAGAVAMNANRTVTVTSSILTVGGGITGGGSSLTKAGSGALRLSGSNTFGGSTVSAGGLIFATRASQPATGTATVAAGATLGLGVSASDGAYFDAAAVDGLFAGTLAGVSNSSGVSNVGIDTSAGNFTYGSSVSGPRGLVKYGANALTLTGASSFSGGTVITDGSVIVGNASGLGTGSVTLPTGGTLDLGGLTIANTVVLAGGALSSGTINASQATSPTGSGRIAAVLSGTGFTKTGTGTLILAGVNTYTGTTSIAAGTLRVERATGSLPSSGPVTVSSTAGLAALVIDNVGATGALSQSVGPLSFAAGAGTVTLVRSAAQDLAISASSLTVGAGATGNLVPGGGTNSAANGFVIAGQAAGFIDPGLYYDGANFAWYDASGFVRGINYGVDTNTRTTGATSSNQTSIAHQQFTGAATGQTTGTFTTLAFTDSATAYTLSSGQVTVTGILKSGTGTTTMSGGSGIRAPSNTDLDIRTDLASGTLAIGHVIAANGTNGLTKSGAGTLSISAQNTFTGLTRPLEGTLVVAAGSSLQNSTLDMSSAGAGTVTFNQASTLGGLTGGRDLGFGGFAVTVGNNGGSTTYSGILSNGSLVKTGTGTLTLSGSSTLANATSVNNGFLAIDWLVNAGQASPVGTATLINLGSGSNAGTLRYTGSGHTTDRAINLSGTTGGGVIEAAGSGGLTLSGIGTATGVGTKTLTLTGTSTATNSIGVIAGSGVSVNKTGSGLWRLTGANSYSGQLTVSDGTLVVAAAVSQNGDSPFGTATLPASLPIIGNSAAGVSGTAALLIQGGNSIDRGFSVAALGGGGATQVVVLGATGPGTALIGSSGGQIRLGRSVTLQASDSATVRFSAFWKDGIGNDNPVVAYTIGSAGNAGVVQLESLLSGSATGVSIVNGTAQLFANGGEQINPATPVTVGSTLGDATLDLNGLSQSLSRLTFAGNSGSVTTGAVAGGMLRLVNSGSVAVSGTGHLISAAMALDDAASFNVASGGRLWVSGVIATGSAGVKSLTKAGAGILELSGANSYSGNTTVSDGTLVVNGGLGSGALSVAAAATLMGSGTIGGAATIAGIHSPGNSPGIETFASDLTYSGGSSQVIWELWNNTISNSPLAYDQIIVGGNLDFAGATSLSLVFTGTGSSVDWDDVFWATDQTWTLFDVAGTTSNFGNFSLTNSPASWLDASGLAFADSSRSANTFTVSQQGSDVLLRYTVVVPEPASLALAAIGIAAAVYAARRRR